MSDSKSGKGQGPNVLFILTDNQTTESLGCYGSKEHETPHIDRLAREGVRFTRAFCANGLCSPTRSTILTGLMPSQHGVHCALTDVSSVFPEDYVVIREFRTLPLTLKNRGYRTAMIGKWHLGQYRKPALGYEHWVTFSKGHTTDFYNNEIADNGQEYEVRDHHIIEFFTEKAIEYLKQQDGSSPFYLQLNYDGPYYLPPTCMGPDPKNPFYERFERHLFTPFPPLDRRMIEQLPEPDQIDNFHPEDEFWRRFINGGRQMFTRMHNDPATMANMAAQNALVDHCIGRVMEALHAQGLDQDTLVIFSSDQSNLYGQHGLWGHPPFTTPAYMYDTTFNVPLIFRQPGTIEPFRVNDMVIGQYDFMPTILDYAGFGDVEIAHSPGRSFAPVLRGNPMTDWVNEAYFEHEESRSIRTPLYFFTRRLEGFGENELYDLIADPGQETNVCGQPEYAEKEAELDKRLTAFFEQYSDPKYDIWRGGRPKGNTYRPWLFRQKYGDDWDPIIELAPLFEETVGNET